MSSDRDHITRSGFVTVIGRPNVGKSTFINRIIGQDLAIVTPKEQTTRNKITAIHTTDRGQIIFQDTPGLHEPKTLLNKSLVAVALKAMEETDSILFMAEPDRIMHEQDKQSVNLIRESAKPAVLAINKVDTVHPSVLLPIIDAYSKEQLFRSIHPISAATGIGIDELLDSLFSILPESPPLFPEDEISDLPTKFFVAELVREQVILQTGQEIPYKTTVVVESFKEGPGRVVIHADIHVERDSHKKIIIGKGGARIKEIGTESRKKIEEFLGSRVHLELFVKVTPNWTKNERLLDEFGYRVKK